MAASLSTIAGKDGAGSAIAGGLQALDKSGTGVGPFTLGHVLIDGLAGANLAAVTAANAMKVDGSAVTQPVSLTSTTITGTVSVTAGSLPLPTGAASAANQPTNVAQGSGTSTQTGTLIIAAASISAPSLSTGQSYPPSLDLAGNLRTVLNAETTKAIGVVRAADGSGNLITSTSNALDVNIKSGAGSGGTAIADEAAFTEGTTSFTPIGGVFETSQTALTTGQAGAVALSAAREMNTLGKVWDGTNTAAVKAASTAPSATDPAMVVAISPNSVNGNGQALMAASAPVVLASDDARFGPTNETAPSTDTATSGFNGRLQRIAQRLTSTIALLPSALGAGGGLKVDGSGTALPVSGTFWQTTQPVSGAVHLGITATANGGTASRVNAAGSTNATSLKPSAGQLFSIDVFNVAAYNVFLKLYDKASAPTVGTDTPVATIPIQAGGGYSKTWPMGIPFSTGIAYAITKVQADSDTTAVTAGDLTGNMLWI